ncbi:MAG: hypothetical protein AMJ95_12385 [Omnitrophica WOR_2 bacterium SM23_72]|nr:MAG: hypothetical protein AMJ95_12385 [Omnitrophica WOR_2 bacterium SM23_72]
MEKLLYVDDDVEIQGLIKDILSKEGFGITVAKDGQEALRLVKADKFDLILLDYLMPGLNGDQVCASLKDDAQTADIPVIMVTAYPNEKERALAAGAVDFIEKPIEKIDLLLRIRSALKVRHIKNELQKIIAYLEELEK